MYFFFLARKQKRTMSAFKIRSANCTDATDPAHSVCTYNVKATDGRTYTGSMTTCVAPMDDGTAVDLVTEQTMKLTGAAKLGTFPTNVSLDSVSCVAGVDPDDGKPKMNVSQLLKKRMASNCGPDFQLSNVTAINKASCQYYGERVDEHGNRGYNYGDRMHIMLASCDEEGYDPRTEQDLKAIVAEQMKTDYFTPDPKHVRCDVLSINPM